MRKTYIVGNWKMNQNLEEVNNFFEAIDGDALSHNAWIAPQAMHIPVALANTADFKIGAQNCSYENSGAFTGEISPKSLKDIGAEFVIIGHSERRAIFKETSEELYKKSKLALENGLKVIFCIGETLEERESGNVESVLSKQLSEGLKELSSEDIIIAYEPVWAIGTGVTATPEQAQETHAFIRKFLNEEMKLNAEQTSILYGGSVKPANVKELLGCDDIDGGLVGGASLDAPTYQALHS